MPIDKIADLLADLLNIWEFLEEIRRWLATFEWSVNALLDLFLHAGWSAVASLVGLWLAYWAVRLLYFALGGRANDEGGFSFALTRRVVGVGVLMQFMMDVLGHAYAVFRQDLPVTLGNLGQHSARDFHTESWCLALVACIGLGIYLVVRMADALKHPVEGPSTRFNIATCWFSYGVAMLASLSAHMWWDRLLSF